MCDSTHCSANDRVGTVRSACPRRCRAASVHGFGLATARALFEDGARVVVTSRSSERAEEVAAAYAIGIGCDVPGAGPGPLSTRMSILPTRLVDSPNSRAAPSAGRFW